ncbi:cytochrome c oxidase assembly protein [Microbacterium lacticum]|uniref:cytochrome c oxidase assembly protein n=1 Tax=Microbacterium lacticum TaxID=33885 RepID=UPI003211A3C2
MRTHPSDALLTTWRADPVTLVVLVAATISYALGIRRAARHCVVWPRRRTVLFFALGLGSYAVVELGFLGAWSAQLRWAFTARIALLLLAVPALIALGKPVELARAGMGEAGRDRLDGVLSGRTARILGNAMLWFIAEAADVPVLLLRWARRDCAEAADLDALTDAEHDALVQAHLRGARAGSDAAR